MRVGLIPPDARVELIDGDLIQMASEGGPHVDHKIGLNQWFVRNLPADYELAPDATLRLAEDNAPEPDLYVLPASMPAATARGADIVLAVELSDTTQSYDLRRKAELYARFEVREYWVFDIPRRLVHVHTRPGVGGYGDVVVKTYEDQLTPEALPGLRLKPADLPRLNLQPPA